MKSIFLRITLPFITSLVVHVANAQKQACNRYDYDYKLGVKYTYGYLLKGDNFELFSDNRRHEEVFISKSDFKRRSRLEIIPVLKVSFDSINGSQHPKSISNIFTPNYYQFSAFLLCERSLVELIISSPEIIKKNATSHNFGAESAINIEQLFSIFTSNEVCLFYDSTARTYSYIKDDYYYYWDFNSKKFSKLQGVDSYRHLIGK